jgi:hypothetical protein
MQSTENSLKNKVVKPQEKESNRKMIPQAGQNGVSCIFNFEAAL